jgi:hypothetical protein
LWPSQEQPFTSASSTANSPPQPRARGSLVSAVDAELEPEVLEAAVPGGWEVSEDLVAGFVLP